MLFNKNKLSVYFKPFLLPAGKERFPWGIEDFTTFPTTTIYIEEKLIRDTSRTKYNNKAVYEFNTMGIQNKYACKCCAMCGEVTDEALFEQQMAMDSVLLIKPQQSNWDFSVKSLPFFYEPGEWRAKIISRLCFECKKLLKAKIDAAFEEFSKDKESNVERKKKKEKNEITEVSRLHVQQHQPFQNSDKIRPSISAGPKLPSIDTLLPNYSNPNNQSFAIHQDQPHDIPPEAMEENAIISMENISLNESHYHPIDFIPQQHFYNIPQTTILIDQYGNQICTWNQSIPTNEYTTFQENSFY